MQISDVIARNSYGRITVRHKGGGNRQKYRIIDFKRMSAKAQTVVGIEYDPNRSSYIALLKDDEGKKSYILAPVGVTDGQVLYSGADADIIPGNTLPLANIPVGTFIHNIELYPGNGAQLVRSAGVQAQLMGREGDLSMIRLPSGEMRYVRSDCKATIGQVGNIEHDMLTDRPPRRMQMRVYHARRRSFFKGRSTAAARNSPTAAEMRKSFAEERAPAVRRVSDAFASP